MKTKLLLPVLFTFVFFNVINAQKTGPKQEVDSIQVITIDYITKTFKPNVIQKNLRVNSWVQFKIINMSKGLDAEGSVNYNNRNLEQKSSFAGYLNFDKNNQYITSKVNTSTKDSIDEKKETADAEIDRVSSNKVNAEKTKSDLPNINKSILENKISTKTKINEVTMIKDLEINDAVNYLKDKKGDKAEKAIIDVNWQKRLIRILQENLINKLKVRDDLLTELSKQVDSLNAKIKTLNDVNVKSFPPVRIENYDYTEFSFQVKNDKNNVVENFNIPFSNKKGFKLDFSTGFVFNGLNSKNYKILPKGTDKVVINEEEKSVSFNTGIALLAHAYSRSGKFANYGLTSGLSFNLNNQNLNYMFGGSLLLGEDQRFIISLGVTAGRVKELVKYYNVGQEIPITELPLTSQVPIVEKLKATWFLSLTYNLGISDAKKTMKL